ncbi:MAG: hypothetical protein RLZ40_783 [Actinomycetota bacterium]
MIGCLVVTGSERLFALEWRSVIARVGAAASFLGAAFFACGALDLSGRPAQAWSEFVSDDIDCGALVAFASVVYSRCSRRPVTTMRVPLESDAAAFSPRSPQAVTLK